MTLNNLSLDATFCSFNVSLRNPLSCNLTFTYTYSTHLLKDPCGTDEKRLAFNVAITRRNSYCKNTTKTHHISQTSKF